LQPADDGRITLVRFVERIPFTGQDWDLVDEKIMLAWRPNKISFCLRCGKPKPARNKYCGRRCSSLSRRGRPHSPEHRKNLSRALSGKRNPRWKGDDVQVVAGNHRARSMYPLEPCEICGSEKSERHHVDGNPMNNTQSNIQFLCRKHHMRVDGRPTGIKLGGARIGEACSNSKLTEADVLQIRSEPASTTHRELSKRYGVHYNTIRLVRCGETWKYLLVA